MITEITLIVRPEEEADTALIQKKAVQILLQKGIQVSPDSIHLVFDKKSIDARHGQVKLCLRYKAYIGEKPEAQAASCPVWKHADMKHRVVIVGSGPAGLFGALRLLESGIQPVIIERGVETSLRKKDIAEISTKGIVGKDSNYCFGEGGAGTFS
ncbi:MAG: FAD-dependent monooxygenase, partial [Treponema sp.]